MGVIYYGKKKNKDNLCFDAALKLKLREVVKEKNSSRVFYLKDRYSQKDVLKCILQKKVKN